LRSNRRRDKATERRSDEAGSARPCPPFPPSLRRSVASSLLFALLFATGCQSARVARPLTLDHGGNDDFEQLEFWHALAGRPVTSNDEAFHGLLLFLDGNDPSDDYAGRVQRLRSRRMLPGGFHQPGDQAVERGTLAVAVVRALKIEGGLALRLTGATPLGSRYAVRELQFMELYPPSSPNQTFSGTEFLGIIGKLEDYRRTEQRPAHAAARGAAQAGSPRPEGLRVAPERRPGVDPELPSDGTSSGQPL
jgi:hypothetical protein